MFKKYTIITFIILAFTLTFAFYAFANKDYLINYKLTTFNPGHYIGVFSLGDSFNQLKSKIADCFCYTDIQREDNRTIVNLSFDNTTLSFILVKGKVSDISTYWPTENLQFDNFFIIPRYTTLSDISKFFPLGRIRNADPDSPCMYYDDVKSGITFMGEPITLMPQIYKNKFKNKKCLTNPGRKPECFVINYIDIYKGY